MSVSEMSPSQTSAGNMPSDPQRKVDQVILPPPTFAPTFALPDRNGIWRAVVTENEESDMALIFTTVDTVQSVQLEATTLLRQCGFRVFVIDGTEGYSSKIVAPHYDQISKSALILFDSSREVWRRYSVKKSPAIALIFNGTHYSALLEFDDDQIVVTETLTSKLKSEGAKCNSRGLDP